MCGIVGIWSSKSHIDYEILNDMSDLIYSRGPDGFGKWMDEYQQIAFAHRRLAILDLSDAGHQPMTSKCGNFVIAFNGEIYNHLELRDEISDNYSEIIWNGHSDTETLLECISNWGFELTLSKLNGMFAFSLWDKRNEELYLVRDRLGEKPIYYGILNETFFFGSQLKSFEPHPDWCGEISKEASELYMQYGYVPSPLSIFNDIYKLQPGHYIVIKDQGRVIDNPKPYWSVYRKQDKELETDLNFHESKLEELLNDSVSKRMLSDVPVGAFLSGGIDSSIVTALMQKNSNDPIKTFSIGFEEDSHNEAVYAKDIANYLNTDHKELYISPEDLINTLPKIIEVFDEPFADPSQIPTYLVAQLASQDVKVVLSGDGGDELFFGYKRYLQAQRLWKKIQFVPYLLRKAISLLIQKTPFLILHSITIFFPKRLLPEYPIDRLLKLCHLFESKDWYQFYETFMLGKYSKSFVLGLVETFSSFKTPSENLEKEALHNKMMLTDVITYLPDDILTKVDRTSMAVSLEARVPLLDHRIVEFARDMPLTYKFREGQQKWILKEILGNYVPKKLTNRGKKGFGIPIDSWLRGPLKDFADDIIMDKEIDKQGYLDSAEITKIWKEHLDGRRRWHIPIWRILIFQMWLQNKKIGKNKWVRN